MVDSPFPKNYWGPSGAAFPDRFIIRYFLPSGNGAGEKGQNIVFQRKGVSCPPIIDKDVPMGN
jgi:hypothetical protein